jgi:hypothetical protein
LPASGWLMIANVRRLLASFTTSEDTAIHVTDRPFHRGFRFQMSR